jgi:hypothetical protein
MMKVLSRRSPLYEVKPHLPASTAAGKTGLEPVETGGNHPFRLRESSNGRRCRRQGFCAAGRHVCRPELRQGHENFKKKVIIEEEIENDDGQIIVLERELNLNKR